MDPTWQLQAVGCQICRVNRHFGIVLLNDGLEAAYDPLLSFTVKEKPPEGGFGFLVARGEIEPPTQGFSILYSSIL